ncbi:bacteriophytochrome (light-regulated signal transduction histidine kinase) [Flammeovirgaceae bacterium 311]|nr:bacteriophytochrome (light-regulated signal transduction histidine kinase) [Flammeovirgaceae bacterium 311]
MKFMQPDKVFKLFEDQAPGFEGAVDLTNCDREPIHIPGGIQPHGILLVLDESLNICQLSENAEDFFGLRNAYLLGKKLQEVIGETLADEISRRLASLTYQQNFKLRLKEFEEPCEAVMHRNEGCIVLEILTCQPVQKNTTVAQYSQVLQKLQASAGVSQLCQHAAEAIKEITGFHRVMVYQFHDDDHGEVVGEALDSQLDPYMGLHYPASDIPKQARLLYLHNPVRLIPAIHYEPVALVPRENPVNDRPLNLALSVLRSVSPIHLQYLENMGVQASMSVSIILNGRLWGLFACHHQEPYQIPYALQEACYLLGRSFSSILNDKLRIEDESYRSYIRDVQAKLLERMSQAENYTVSLRDQNPTIKDLVSCSGCAICFGDDFYTLGDTPTQEQIMQLTAWLQKEVQEDVFSSRTLSGLYPAAAAFKDKASGLLAVSISRTQREYILWFRPEVIETVRWAGRPDKAVEVGADSIPHLSPRKSFAIWSEEVSGASLPWKTVEEQAAKEIRGMLVDVVLRTSGELKLRAGILARLNKELERSNSELDSFAYIASHDLKEPLRGIHNYSQFLLEDYYDQLDSAGKDKLTTLMRLTLRMEQLIDSLMHYSRLGRADIQKSPVDLNKVLEGVKDSLLVRLEDKKVGITIAESLPVVECDALLVHEIFQNLLSNAIKYNDNEEVKIVVGWFTDERPKHKESRLVFFIKDNGIGIDEQHFGAVFNIFRRLHARQHFGGGTGVGLTIVKKLVERHGGEIWLESGRGEGTTFFFSLQE